MKRRTLQLIILFATYVFSIFLLFPGKTAVKTEEEAPSSKAAREPERPPVETHICDGAESVVFAASSDMEAAAFEPIPTEYAIQDFPLIWQLPELPTGCEITALTMVLEYYGYDVDKTTMAAEYLPTAEPDFFYGEDGTLYGPDILRSFVGDPSSEFGYICGAPAIQTAANDYLLEHGGAHAAVDKTGASLKELYELVARNIPVVVWVTIEMEDRYDVESWYTDSGEYMDWSTQDHGAVLIGYSQDTVSLADPISGMVDYDREQFESVFESRGSQCVIITGARDAEV